MKKIIIALLLVITGLIAFYKINSRVGLVDLSRIHVETDNQLSPDKVKIQRGFYSINRQSDQDLFDKGNGSSTVFDGRQVALLGTDYGENDFLITYDNAYYFQFRHWKFNHKNQHTYNFYFYRTGIHINVRAKVDGIDRMDFDRPMNPISIARQLRCNTPIDSTKTLYNMIGLIKSSH
jgi:hypothetical protein